MKLPASVRRQAYRAAHVALRTYWFVIRPELVGVKCVLTNEDRVLLVRHTYGRREWDLPGGSVKRQEPPVRAARREMEEELGRSIDDWVALGEMFVQIDRRRDNLYCFRAELRDPDVAIDPGELAAARWFPRDQLPPDLGRFVRPILARAWP